MPGNERVLSPAQVLAFFAVLCLVYVFPIVHADYAYVDDNWRALLQAQDAWRNQGRILLEWLYKMLTFSQATINIFPLPLLISIFALALAMSRLTFWLFPRPGITSCLVILPVLCNPFFLGNLTYQYDGPGMVLAQVAVIYAITCRIEPRAVRGLLVALLIAATLSLYQLTISLFIGLSIVEFVRGIKDKVALRALLVVLVERVVQLVAGGLIYFFSAYQLAVDTRGSRLPFDQQWLEVVWQKFCFSMQMLGVLGASAGTVLTVALLLGAGAGFMMLMTNICQIHGRPAGKLGVALLYLLSLVALAWSVPGMMLFLSEPNLEARNFIGFSAVLLLLFYLNHQLLGRIWPGLRWLLLMPTLFMFTFSYAYGQVIIAKKELESAMAYYIANDLVSRTELRGVNTYTYLRAPGDGNWLPRGHGAMTHMPLLRYILSGSNSVLHAQFLPRLGINNVIGGEPAVFDRLVAQGDVGEPLVDNKFYSIYVSGAQGFIVMKPIQDDENYNHNWPRVP
ncbi:glucosyltransferase domain-containing protein [Pseudomonas rubra]|uniref:Glucosyltransferase domain-containing protein n=1 Tax=Pseudomonas rubra TaxID=2942627 RepID=A0ABT5PC00_9PSED|nr:glucosyltransferase domain-containing protein [Pseudomonas rubra]MDD1015834.1 glucosyltransferase domain-containing protein [Pseudomonas rubra]MDD1036757.1 glucosyltransferase domain-containing protein [Pseudomonas rubra]MDD1157276.1 glucosyltransferase domain-containing protein [Pseudomonas rubra]